MGDNLPTGRYFAAWPDNDGSMCGKCFEVKCAKRSVRNLYGENYDHTSEVCQDTNKKITILISDACPCNGNEKWCCGGNKHLDMSHEAFYALSNGNGGIMAIDYTEVPCPGKRANNCNGGQKQIKAWQMCGGIWGVSQDKCCPPYHKCTKRTPFWYQCLVDKNTDYSDGSNGNNGRSNNSGNNNSNNNNVVAATRRKRRSSGGPKPKPRTVKKQSNNRRPSKSGGGGGCKKIGAWGQCGGVGGPSGNRRNGRDGLWKGYCCANGKSCRRHNNWFWQCM